MADSPAHHSNLHVLVATLQEASHAVAAWLARPDVDVQIAIIAVFGAASLWLAIPLRRRLDRSPAKRAWLALGLRALGPIAGPLLWLIGLWITILVAAGFGSALTLVSAAASLVLAWVIIRLISAMAVSDGWSQVIAALVWAIAALHIVGLMHPLLANLAAAGIDFGRYRLSLLNALRALFVFVVVLWLGNRGRDFLEARISRASTLAPSMQALLLHALGILVPIAATVMALAVLGVDLTALAVFSGAIGIGIGLGLQSLASNVIGGFVLILDKSIKKGDVIAVGGSFGRVTNLGARYVSLRNRDGIEHLIPNQHFIQNGVENWSHTDRNVRLKIPVGVAYDTDLRHAMALCLDAAKAVPRVLAAPAPTCLLTGFGDSAVNLEIRVWIEDPQNGVGNVKSAVLLGVWDRFKDAQIVLPFLQRELHIVPPAQ